MISVPLPLLHWPSLQKLVTGAPVTELTAEMATEPVSSRLSAMLVYRPPRI